MLRPRIPVAFPRAGATVEEKLCETRMTTVPVSVEWS